MRTDEGPSARITSKFGASLTAGLVSYSSPAAAADRGHRPSRKGAKMALIFLQEEGGLALGEVAREFIGFLPYFGIFGALGFYFLVLRRTPGLPPESVASTAAARRAGMTG